MRRKWQTKEGTLLATLSWQNLASSYSTYVDTNGSGRERVGSIDKGFSSGFAGQESHHCCEDVFIMHLACFGT